MTPFSMKKILVVMFCSLLFRTVSASGPYASCPSGVLSYYGYYDFSVTTDKTCPYPQFPTPTYYGGGDGNSVFFQACMVWAGSFGNTNEVKSKKTGCTFYKEGVFYLPLALRKYECCNLADCNSACVRHIVTCAACADAQTSA